MKMNLTLISSSFWSGIILLIKTNDSYHTVHNTLRLVSCLILDIIHSIFASLTEPFLALK